MRHVIVVWWDGDPDHFEQCIPLRFMSQRATALGISGCFDLVFLYGYESVGQTRREELAALGYCCHDASQYYRRWTESRPELFQFGTYEANCFLRWPILEEYFSGEALVSYDADLVLNLSTTELERRTHGKTFVLQGCPALTVISDTAWFDCYRRNLAAFASDIPGYSARAWSLRSGWQESLRTKWAGSRFRPIISSDQDLLSHLIHVDDIPQGKPPLIEAAFAGYILFENPLELDETNVGAPFNYRRTGNYDFLNDRKVALWHMQSEWVFYLLKLMARLRYWPVASTRLGRASLDVEGILLRLHRRLVRQPAARRSVYEFFLAEKGFGAAFNDATWWKKGVFS